MPKFKIIQPVNFGDFTIGDKNYGPACPSCMVPINNYAPKVGQVIEGNLETKPIGDGNGHTTIQTGIVWPIYTNGQASTTGQISIQFIPQDRFVPYVPANEEPANPNPPSNPSNTTNTENTQADLEESRCWICKNGWIILVVLLVIIGLFLLINNDQINLFN